jgi:hypothetical protein
MTELQWQLSPVTFVKDVSGISSKHNYHRLFGELNAKKPKD